MLSRRQAIRELAAKALAAGAVDAVLGYAPGSLPMRMRPFVARSPGDAQKLDWDGFCQNDLARQLLRLARKEHGRLGVVAQGCISRNLVVLLKEGRLDRERLYVIGVPCLGMIDRRKLAQRFGPQSLLRVEDTGERLLAVTARGERRASREPFVRDNCLECLYRNPVLADEFCAPALPESVPQARAQGRAPGGDACADDRLAAFEGLYEGCLRCDACQAVCSLCEDLPQAGAESDPRTSGEGALFDETGSYHILRAFHLAGRCTDCGACEAACPQGVALRRLTLRINRDVRLAFGHTAGLRLDDPFPLFPVGPRSEGLYPG